MSKYEQYLACEPDVYERACGVEDFIDDVEKTLNLEGKGYIACLKKIQELKKELEETKASEQLSSHVATVNAEDIVELRKENVGLKDQNEYLKLQLKKQDNIHHQDGERISEEKMYSTEQRERGDKYMEENEKLKKRLEDLQDICRNYKKEFDLEHIRYMEEQGKRGDLQVKIEELKEELKEELLEGIKLHNTNHLYKGFVCSHVIEKLKGDIECVGDGQVDINFGEWLGLFYGEKFYEEIIPVIIKEITEHKEVGNSYEDGYWYYSWADKYELEHNKGGCISYTRIEDTSDEE